MPLAPQITLQAFYKWAVDFVGLISPPGKRTGTRYIITTIDYLTRWDEAAPIKYFTTAQKKHLVMKVANYTLITGHLYKMGPNDIFRRCVFYYE